MQYRVRARAPQRSPTLIYTLALFTNKIYIFTFSGRAFLALEFYSVWLPIRQT